MQGSSAFMKTPLLQVYHSLSAHLWQRHLFLFATLCLGLTGCDIKFSSNTDEIRKTGFVYCSPGGFNTLNPQLNEAGIINATVAPQIFDTLVTLDHDGNPLPSLALDWQASEDHRQFLFTLRNDVSFQHTPWFTPSRLFNADDVVFSFNRMLDSKNPFYYVHQGHYPLFESSGLSQLIESVERVDSHHVLFKLKRENYAFVENLSASFTSIHSKEYANQLVKSGHKRLLDTQPIGTGPYQFVDSQQQKIIRLTRNDNFWGQPAILRQVVFNLGRLGTGSLAQLLRNECDVMSAPISSQLDLIQQDPTLSLNKEPAMNVSYLAMNTKHYALSKPKVREALYYAINRKNIIDSVYYGSATAARHLLSEASWPKSTNYVKPTPQYDLNKAQQLLKESGVALPLSLDLLVQIDPKIHNPSPKKTAELIQADLGQLGIHVNVVQNDERMRRVITNQGDADLILSGWTSPTQDPDSLYRPTLSCQAYKNGLNIANWCNRKFDNLLNLANKTNDREVRRQYYKQINNLISYDIPMIPIAHSFQYQVYHNSLTGFDFNPFNSGRFNQVKRVY